MIAAPIQIGDEQYICVVEIIENLKEKRLYVHETFLTKNLLEVVASNLVHGSETSSPQPQGDVAKIRISEICTKFILDKRALLVNALVSAASG